MTALSISSPFAPLGIVVTTALLAFALEVVARRPVRWLAGVSAAGLAAALAVEATRSTASLRGLGGLMRFDSSSHLATLVVLGAALAVVVASAEFERTDPGSGDYHCLVLFSVTGALVLASAGDFVTVFLGLEAMSIPLYALVAYRGRDRRAPEGALKFFLLGAFATAIMLFGMSLLVGVSGTTRLEGLGTGIAQASAGGGGQTIGLVVVAALALTAAGLAFKLGVAPLHFWVMDAYEASTPAVGGLLATVPKMAALVALQRLLEGISAPSLWQPACAFLAVLSLAVGAFGGLRQRSVARLMGYSSVAQAGYVLIGLAAGTAAGFGAALSYFAAYSIAALGVFLAVGIEHPQDAGDVDGLDGLSARRPLVGVALAAFTLSLVGIPPFVGFFGKFGLFSAAIAAGWGWLAVVGLVFSVVSLGYYGTLLRAAFLSDAEPETRRIPRVGFAGVPVGALAGLTALVALSPGLLFIISPA